MLTCARRELHRWVKEAFEGIKLCHGAKKRPRDSFSKIKDRVESSYCGVDCNIEKYAAERASLFHTTEDVDLVRLRSIRENLSRRVGVDIAHKFHKLVTDFRIMKCIEDGVVPRMHWKHQPTLCRYRDVFPSLGARHLSMQNYVRGRHRGGETPSGSGSTHRTSSTNQ
ncbi:hypothetical protein AVEN_250959-1 [Araneus ventricosus]|uniref:Uncharacterized protein n=1 Tax=Araneus ventricosus TaxID=182803 RepID=A0A4Y2P3M7_ARAVE|nr:hypothetical protein AVEN_250959-1 [Araneus ventricosus]